MLRTFAKKLFADTPVTEGPTSRGTLSDVQLHLDTPFYGEVNGAPVTIIGQGNMVGFSPVSKCIDGDGETAWIPDSSVLITDPRFQPVGPSTRAKTTRPK
jgi:hypothetical protein